MRRAARVSAGVADDRVATVARSEPVSASASMALVADPKGGRMKPTIGRVVIYRTDGRNGLVYDLPAIVTCTRDSHPGDYPDGSRNPLPVPGEHGDMVHLTVLTPGGFGSRVSGVPTAPTNEDWKDAPAFTPGSGSYVEWDVPQGTGPRSWRWPTIE